MGREKSRADWRASPVCCSCPGRRHYHYELFRREREGGRTRRQQENQSYLPIFFLAKKTQPIFAQYLPPVQMQKKLSAIVRLPENPEKKMKAYRTKIFSHCLLRRVLCSLVPTHFMQKLSVSQNDAFRAGDPPAPLPLATSGPCTNGPSRDRPTRDCLAPLKGAGREKRRAQLISSSSPPYLRSPLYFERLFAY